MKKKKKNRIQHCERSELRLHFKWTKVDSKCQKWSILASFLKPEACGQTVLPDRSILIGQKLAENAKIQNFKCDILSNLNFFYRRKARKIFERNLELSGLHLERESKMDAFDRKTSFVKIHVPKSVVDRNADILGLTSPVKEFLVTAYMSTSRNVRDTLFEIFIFCPKIQL